MANKPDPVSLLPEVRGFAQRRFDLSVKAPKHSAGSSFWARNNIAIKGAPTKPALTHGARRSPWAGISVSCYFGRLS